MVDKLELKRRSETAHRLAHDDVLMLAFDQARRQTMEALAKADAGEPNAIIRLQARVAAIDDIRTELQNLIIAAPREAKAVI